MINMRHFLLTKFFVNKLFINKFETKKIIVIAITACVQATASAESIVDSINNGGAASIEQEAICYLPTESNVSYQDMLALLTQSPDHVIAYGDNQFQFGELWLPKSNALEQQNAQAGEPSIRHPLVVFIHGGCWLNSFDIQHTHALSTALMGAGYAVWSVEYRRTGDVGGAWPGTYHDIKRAIEYLPQLSAYPVDLNNVALVGHSAGGHLALLAGSENLYEFDAVIGLAAIVDIERYAEGDNSCQIATPQFMGGAFADNENAYNKANPAKYEPHASTVLIHGSADEIVDVKQASYLASNSHIINGAGHFDMLHPGTQSYQALLKELAKAFK